MKKINNDIGWGKNINHKNFTIKGWGYEKEHLKWYKDKLKKIKNGKVVEIGVYGGASILCIADLCMKNNIKIYGIDPWENTTIVNGRNIKNSIDEINILTRKMVDARTNLENIIKKLNYSNINLIQNTSEEASLNFKNNDIDIVYIDGDHSYEAVSKDLKIWHKKIKQNGIIWGDDYGWLPVRKAINNFAEIKKMKINRLTRGKWFLSRK